MLRPLFTLKTKAIAMNLKTCLGPAAMALALAAPLSATAQDAGWERKCSDTECVLALAFNEAESQKRAGTLLVVLRDGQSPLLGLVTPLGVALAAGARMLVDEDEIAVPFQVCFPDGCRGFAEVDDARIDALSAAQKTDLRFFAYGQEKPLAIEVPLDGLDGKLTEARDELGQ